MSSTYTFSKTIEEGIQQPGQQDDTDSFIDQTARRSTAALPSLTGRTGLRFPVSGRCLRQRQEIPGDSNRFVDAISRRMGTGSALCFQLRTSMAARKQHRDL